MIGVGMGNSQRGRDHGLQAHGGNGTHHLPRVQRGAAEQDGQVPERHVQAGRGGLALLALRVSGREVF